MNDFWKHVLKLQLFLVAFAIFAKFYVPDILSSLVNVFHFKNSQQETTIFTKEQLAIYNGENGAPLYLVILGSVYDVTKGKKHYGRGCAYNFFIGRDASVSFITGEFDSFVEQQADDVITLQPNELLTLANWKNFYESDYIFKGKLIGRFYDAYGTPTVYKHKYLALLEQAQKAKESKERLRDVHPDCNIEWSKEIGTRVWCTASSGGRQRQWIGYPRKLFKVDGGSYRCACIRKEDLDTTTVMLKEYDNCARVSHDCYYKVE